MRDAQVSGLKSQVSSPGPDLRVEGVLGKRSNLDRSSALIGANGGVGSDVGLRFVVSDGVQWCQQVSTGDSRPATANSPRSRIRGERGSLCADGCRQV
jgi:hypothetical protein